MTADWEQSNSVNRVIVSVWNAYTWEKKTDARRTSDDIGVGSFLL